MLSEILPIAVELVPDNSQKLLAFGVFPGGGGRLSRLKHARLSPFDKVRERKARNVHPSEIFMRGTHSYTVIFETYFRRSLIRHLGTHLTSRIYQTVPPLNEVQIVSLVLKGSVSAECTLEIPSPRTSDIIWPIARTFFFKL